MRKPAVNIVVQAFFMYIVLFLLGQYLEVGLLCYKESICLAFLYFYLAARGLSCSLRDLFSCGI